MAKKKDAAASEPWDRMPGESVRNYGYFCAYRDMRYTPAASSDDLPKLDLTSERSIRRLAAQVGKSRMTIGGLSSKYNWQARCDAYDLYILRRLQDRNEAKIIRMRENHAAIGEQMLKRAMRRLLSLGDDEIEAADMIRMVDVGVKVERLSRGESTEKQEVSGKTAVEHSGAVAFELPDLSALTDEEVEQYERILGKLFPNAGD